MVVQSVRDLRVWQSGMELVVEVYELARTFPKSEVYGLASQLQRAAVSVPANIDEGHTYGSLREYLHFLSIAPSSPAEVETNLELDQCLSYTTPERARPPRSHDCEPTAVDRSPQCALQPPRRRPIDV